MLLQQAIDLIKSGQKEKANKILIQLVNQEPDNDSAWLWLAVCVDNNERKIYCLKRAIEINPENRNARLALDKLTSFQPSLADIISQGEPDLTAGSDVFPPKTAQGIANAAWQSKPGIEFIAAKCPNCGGELRIPGGLDKAKCTYCGYDIIVHNANRIQVETRVDVDKLLGLAKIAEDGGNLAEAYSLYSQVIEYDSGNVSAWVGKGYTAGMQSTREKYRHQETIACFNQALTIGISDNEIKKVAALHLCEVALLYFIIIAEQCNEALSQYEAQQRNVGLGGLILKSMMDNARAKVSPVFTQEHAPTIIKLLTMAWGIHPSEDIAKRIYDFVSSIQTAYFVSETDTEMILNWMAELRDKIRNTLPNWKSPEPGKKKRPDCFIATATMGDYDHPYVLELRYFRDNTLSNYKFGRFLIKMYYQYSPPLAELIRTNRILRFYSLELIIKPTVAIARMYRKLVIHDE